MNNFVIRPARAQDIDILTSIIKNTIESYGYIFEHEFELPDFISFEQFYATGDAELWVMEIDGELAGCGALKGKNSFPYLSRIYMDERFRGRGAGKAMVLHLMQRAVGIGFNEIELWSDTKFRTAHKLYERLGFRFTGRVRPLGDINNCFEYHYYMDASNHPYISVRYSPTFADE